jgi:HTH-type transcriptional regulator/antitoxin HigA
VSNQNIVNEAEIVANLAAAEFCVPKTELDNFYNRIYPLFSEQKVLLFANRIGVHMGIVVGQLQRKLNRYDYLRSYQVKIRSYAISGALTDGWGFIEII